MKRRYRQLQQRFVQTPPESCAISVITYAEILFGLESVPNSHPAHALAVSFVSGIQILDWPGDAAPIYASIRHQLRRQLIGDRDTMIASHAIALDATLVTNNTRHFARVGPTLKLANWLE
jgi:tRNA(fMet)-specific endonuclease VapC